MFSFFIAFSKRECLQLKVPLIVTNLILFIILLFVINFTSVCSVWCTLCYLFILHLKGLEFVDGHFFMSCVVTNKWSDCSTHLWAESMLALRIHKIQDDYVVGCPVSHIIPPLIILFCKQSCCWLHPLTTHFALLSFNPLYPDLNSPNLPWTKCMNSVERIGS